MITLRPYNIAQHRESITQHAPHAGTSGHMHIKRPSMEAGGSIKDRMKRMGDFNPMVLGGMGMPPGHLKKKKGEEAAAAAKKSEEKGVEQVVVEDQQVEVTTILAIIILT